jgi:hypothetical protein
MDICAPTPLDPRHANSSREFGRDGANDHENPLFPSRPLPLFHKLSFPPSNLTSSAATLSGGRQSTAKGCSKGRSVLWTHTSNQSTKLHAAVSDIPSFMVSLRPRSVSSLTDYQATASKPENTGLRCGYDGFGFSLSSPIDHLVLPSAVVPPQQLSFHDSSSKPSNDVLGAYFYEESPEPINRTSAFPTMARKARPASTRTAAPQHVQLSSSPSSSPAARKFERSLSAQLAQPTTKSKETQPQYGRTLL